MHLMKYLNTVDNWDECPQPATFLYCVKVQKLTKFSPIEMMYGVKARLPINLEGEEDVDPSDAQLTDDGVVVRAASLKLTREKGKEKTTKNEMEQKQIYDTKHRTLVVMFTRLVTRS